MLVLMDASILMYLTQKPSTFLMELHDRGDFKLCVPEPVLRELKGLTASRGRRAKAAAMAYEYAKTLDVVEAEGEADESLVRLAVALGAAVATLDRRLMVRLRSTGVPIATVKDDHLMFTGTLISKV